MGISKIRLAAISLAIGTVVISAGASGQTVSTLPLSSTALCVGDSVTVGYSASGSFGPKNVFTVQLSGPGGSFTGTFQNIASVRSTQSGSIGLRIGALWTVGAKYRLRVVASTPYTVGTDNGSDIVVAEQPTESFSASRDGYTLAGDTVQFWANEQGTGNTYAWDFGPNANPSTSGLSFITVTYPNAGTYDVGLTVTNNNGCVGIPDTVSIRAVHVLDCDPQIPSTAVIDSVNEGLPYEVMLYASAIWVVPGGSLTLSPRSYAVDHFVVFAEPGSTVHCEGSKAIIYAKDGASIIGTPTLLVHSGGVGMTNVAGYSKALCSSLSFDYSVAPPYSMKQAAVPEGTVNATSFHVFPNPASRVLHLESDRTPDRIVIRSISGAEVLRFDRALGREMDLGVGALAAGVYSVELMSRGNTSVERVVISR